MLPFGKFKSKIDTYVCGFHPVYIYHFIFFLKENEKLDNSILFIYNNFLFFLRKIKTVTVSLFCDLRSK